MDEYEQLKLSLTNQTPNEDQIRRIEKIREGGILFGEMIINSTGDSRNKSLAKTHLEEAVMWAVKAIVLEEKK